MSDPRMEKRDLVLPPGTYAFMQDVTKGVVKVYTGPTVINPTAQEIPVIYDAKKNTYSRCSSLEEALRSCVFADEGYYVVLKNPAKMNRHPEPASASNSADLETGREIVIPGPHNFGLWPGQGADVIEGHHLRSNQYLLVRVYNEEEARKNWSSAVMKPATDTGNQGASNQGQGTGSGETVNNPPPPEQPQQPQPVVKAAPVDLTVGKQLIIKGTEVSFYIPPTGIVVVPNDASDAEDLYVRNALTLERLEYCILVDENGRKRYEYGPQVVFPLPSERFIETTEEKSQTSSKKFRAIELNEIQGLHVKVIADYEDNGKKHAAGEELFITGKDTAIYYPREEHGIIKYDGRSKHFATAVPAGEARYVMNRITGEIKTWKGPAMLLPDPRHEVMVRRALSDKQASLWYPANQEVLDYNRSLRTVLSNAPTTRQGAVSEGDFERALKSNARSRSLSVGATNSRSSFMESSQVSRDQSVVGEEFSRGSTYTQPRSITLDSKFQGAPAIDVWTGYAVMVVSKTGKRRVEKGPTTILLDYDETLEVLEMSMGKPKTTDSLLRTTYLRTENNKVSDVVQVETADHVIVDIYVSFRVNFEGDALKWFSVENYVKFLCDHARSVLKGAVRKIKVEEFYAGSTEIIRNVLLGEVKEGKREGMLFSENGMRVSDVEVLKVTVADATIRALLDQAQHQVIKTNIDLSTAKRDLEVVKQKESIEREVAETRATTIKRKKELDIELAEADLAVGLARIANQIAEFEHKSELLEQQLAQEALQTTKQLGLDKMAADQRLSLAKQQQEQDLVTLKAEVEAVVEKFKAASGGFSEALLSLSNNDTMVKVAEAWSIQRVIGGESISDALSNVFAGSPLQGLVQRITAGEKPVNGAPART